MNKYGFAIALCLFALSAGAASPAPAVYQKAVKADIDTTQKKLSDALDNGGFAVVRELDIGANLAKFAGKWGADYNRNKLENIRSIVFCNGRFTNQISNEDPAMLALCPLHVTLIHKAGVTTVLFARPSSVAQGSKAVKTVQEMEQAVIEVIDKSLGGK